MDIFTNTEQNRARAGWRLLLQYIIMQFLTAILYLALQSVWQTSLNLAFILPSFLAAVASIWLAARVLDKRPFTEYGLKFDKTWIKEFVVGALIAAVAMIFIFGVEWAMGWLQITGFGWSSTADIPFAVAIISSLFAMLMVGFYEELFSRGYQILNLTEGLRYPQIGVNGAVAIAVLFTSALFGFLHSLNPNASFVAIFNITLAGIALALPYILTGSLALSVGLHFSWNFTQGSILGFMVSGLDLGTSVIQIRQTGTDLWTGGAFGPEAGLMGVMGMAIMMGLSLVYIKMMGYELAITDLFREEKSTVKTDEQGL